MGRKGNNSGAFHLLGKLANLTLKDDALDSAESRLLECGTQTEDAGKIGRRKDGQNTSITFNPALDLEVGRSSLC